MIKMLTGAIGTGKTTYCVDELIKAQAENQKHIKNGDLDKVRKIYSNIAGLKVQHEPLPDDWRTTPKNSIIAYDEAHKIAIFQPTRNALHSDPRIVAMNESRHTGHDIYFITQSPKFIHQHIRGLVNQHFHFHNPMGLKVATVFMWRHGNTTTPDSDQAKNKAENSFIYQFDEKVQNNFDSIEEDAQHTRKRNIPKKVIFWGLAPLALLAVIVMLLMKPETTGNLTGETFVNKTKDDLKKAEAATANIAPSDNKIDFNTECRKAVNVEKPACVEWFNNLSNTKGSISDKPVYTYDPDKPYDFDYRPQVAPTDFPRISGVIQISSGRLMAVDQQGNYMPGISEADCKKWLDGYRPFNYFIQNQHRNEYQSSNLVENKSNL